MESQFLGQITDVYKKLTGLYRGAATFRAVDRTTHPKCYHFLGPGWDNLWKDMLIIGGSKRNVLFSRFINRNKLHSFKFKLDTS